MWIEKFFGPDQANDQRLKDLFANMDHGIDTLYNPESCVHAMLKPSYFDIEDYRIPTTSLQTRNCQNLFKDAITDDLKEAKLIHCLRQLHYNMRLIGIRSLYPKHRQEQLIQAQRILSDNSEDMIKESCGQAFQKLRDLNDIVQVL